MAAAAAAAQGWFHGCMFDGSISSHDTEIRHRPYHRNCSCALHGSHSLPQDAPCSGQVSYPKRQSWSGASISAADGAQICASLHVREEDVYYC